MAEVDTPQELDLELVRRVQHGESAAFDVPCASTSIGWWPWSVATSPTGANVRTSPGHFHPRLPRDREFPWRRPVLNPVASNRREYRQNYLASHNRRPPTDDIDIGDAEQFDTGTRLRDTDTPERELMRRSWNRR